MLIKSYFKTGFRNFYQHKSFTLLNVIGLALGMSASLLILQYVKYEQSYDTFHQKAHNIYRIQYNLYQNGNLTFECAAAVPAIGPALKDNFPEVVQFTRLCPVSGAISYHSAERGLITFREETMQIADPAVFEVFDFKLIKGNAITCLEGPNKVVLSKSAARKYFKGEDPIGKTIKWGINVYGFSGEKDFEVTGIMDDVPNNSHLKLDFLFSYQTINNHTNNASETSWQWYDFYTYVYLKPGTNQEALQKKWNEYVLDTRGELWKNSGNRQEFILQPLLDIHLYSDLLQESNPEEQGDGNRVYFLTVIAFFILIIAWVNYVNMSIAKSMERAKEIGIRKVLGADKNQLRNQFISESILLNFLAMIIAVVLVVISWPSFSSLSGRPIPFSFIYEPSFWILTLGLFLIGTVISGFYPAWVLASIKPATILKGKITGSTRGVLMRKGLVVFQFFASVILINGTIIVARQLNFMKNHDLGFDIYKTLVLERPSMTDSLYLQKLESFKTEALRISGISSITASSNVPGNEIFETGGINRLLGGPEASIMVYNIAIDYDYIPSFDFSLIAGRNFNKEFPSDKEGVVLNRSLAESLEFLNPEEAIGESIRLGRDTFQIVGVIDDYHQMSLKSNTAPIVMYIQPNFVQFYSLKVESNNYPEMLASIRIIWDEFFPGNPYDYFFLDEFFDRQYDSDRQFGQVFGLFSGLAIFVACLGLFGLASFVSTQRTKEVGIRKALGSNVQSISLLLAGGFVKLVLLGAFVATPLAWFIMTLWLEAFPNRITINPLIFVVSVGIVLLIAVFSVGYQTIKTARVNPADTLRYE